MSSEKEREASDLARLWEQALAKYAETTGKDLAMLPRFKSVSDLVEDSEIKTNMFKKWRNPEDKVDKLRSALGKTTEVLGKLVEIAGSAANGVSIDIQLQLIFRGSRVLIPDIGVSS